MTPRLSIHFDMDGTLWCNEARNRSIAQDTAKTLCATLASVPADFWPRLWDACAGKTETHLHGYLAAQGHELECTPAEYERLCRDQWSARRSEAVIDDGMLRFVFKRRTERCQTSIVTSSHAQDIDDFFAVLRDRAYFERPQDLFYITVSSDDVSPDQRKPHPRPYLVSAERMGANPMRNNIWVGDSASDLSGAAAFPNTGSNWGIFKNPHPAFDLPPHAYRITHSDAAELAYQRALVQMGMKGDWTRPVARNTPAIA